MFVQNNGHILINFTYKSSSSLCDSKIVCGSYNKTRPKLLDHVPKMTSYTENIKRRQHAELCENMQFIPFPIYYKLHSKTKTTHESTTRTM